jgi:hypothetical protein
MCAVAVGEDRGSCLAPSDAGVAIGYIDDETEGATTMNDRKISATRPALSVRHGVYVERPHCLKSLRLHP